MEPIIPSTLKSMFKTIPYHKTAEQFIASWIESNPDKNIRPSFRLAAQTAKEAKAIGKSLSLERTDYQNAVVAAWFWWPGLVDITKHNDFRDNLLTIFFDESGYPADERVKVRKALDIIVGNKEPANDVERIVADAVNSQFSSPDLVKHITILYNEASRLTGIVNEETRFFMYFKNAFLNTSLYSDYAVKHYTAGRETNFSVLEKKIQKLEAPGHPLQLMAPKPVNGTILTNRETDDFFKIAFRNYNHLVSVADSKASLLINVNSIIISVMLAFVIGKAGSNTVLLWPTIILLAVCVATIFLSVLASRPQKNILSGDKHTHSYQRFFFGGFDLIDPGFRHVEWEEYFDQLSALFSSAKEKVWLEVYRETFNVRKVLSKKFNYLAIAYWVFIIGLMLSITAFIIAIQFQKFN
jgi:Family of unknown function (DUF5706)